MKKIWLLLILVSLLLCSCQNGTVGGPNTDEGGTPHENSGGDTPDVITYEDIERREATSYKANHYGFKNDSTLLKISLPSEWTLDDTDTGFDIWRDGEALGCLAGACADDLANWTILKTESRSVGNVRVTKYIEEKNGDTVFRYRYVYGYQTDGSTRTVTLTAACAEIDEKTEKKLYTDITTVEKRVSDTVGALSSLGNSTSILILGNSFVNTSDIGNILREMLHNNGKDCNVEAISRGHATVETYASDEPLLDSIREGTYDAVFMCGFYGSAQIEHLGVIKKACDASTTQLVIFPAHNESANAVAAAGVQYPELFCLNWKAEINTLISNGVDRWDLCEDDTYKHSKPLAGYVGAHMIYRAIYDDLPSEPMQYSMSQSFIDSILGDYAYKADLKVVDESKITYFD